MSNLFNNPVKLKVCSPSQWNDLVPCECPAANYPQAPAKTEAKPLAFTRSEKDKKMSREEIYNDVSIDVRAAESDISKTKSYFENRISNIFWEKDRELEKKFGLRDDEAPQNAEELIARIKDGKFTIPEKYKGSGYAIQYIQWRDPDLKRDYEGCNAAVKLLRAEQTKALDIIAATSSGEKMLEAVQAFEAWTHKKK